MEKKNYGKTILIAILFLIIGGIGGYFTYDILKEKEPVIENKFNMYKLITNSYTLDDSYSIFINSNKNLFIKYNNEQLNDKYGEYKIADNVIDFYIIPVGNGGGNGLYFIYGDKTVGYADIEYSVLNDKDIEITKKLEYKNIISVIPWLYTDGISGAWGPAFIDDNGTIHKQD